MCVCFHVNDGWIQLLLLNRCRISYEYYFALVPLAEAPPGGEPCISYYLLYLTQPVTKYYDATSTSRNFCALTYVHAAYIELIARVICSGSTSTYRYPILYFVVMIPPSFRKQYSLSSKICVRVFVTLMMRGYSYYF